MRLTLRTLLSWKDGMLDAAAAADLAARVASSESARGLVARIDEVIADAATSAAAPDTTDANATAEYLDNVLDADRLAEFERRCFQSETLLAETAATHELLASWWREPAADLSAAGSRRLLEAARARAGVRRDLPAMPRRAAARPRIAAAPAVPAAPPRRAPVAAWLLVAAAILLLATLVGVLGWSLNRPSKRSADRRDVAARPADAAAGGPVAAPAAAPVANASSETDGGAGVERASPEASAAAVDPPAAGPSRPPLTQPRDPAPEVPAEPPSAAPESVAVVSPAVEPAPAMPQVSAADDGRTESPPAAQPPVPPAATAPAAPGDRRVPQGDALAIAAPAAAPVVVPPVVAAPRVAAPVADPVAAPAVVAGPAVLLYRPSADAQAPWRAEADGSKLGLPAELLAPSFGAPTLDVGGHRITLEPGTRAALGRDADGTLRLEVVFGAAAVAVGGRLGITAGDLAGVVTTVGPMGVQADLARAPGEAAEAVRRVVRIMPGAAPAEWRQTAADGGPRGTLLGGVGPVVTVPAGAALAWRSDRPDVAEVEAVGPLPAWLAGRGRPDSLDALAAGELNRRLAAGTEAVPALHDMAAARRVESRVAAAATLALLGEFDAVARLLAADGTAALPLEWWKKLDAVAVRRAIARGPKAADGLSRALASRVPAEAADTALRFARGFSDDDVAAGGAAELVEGLGSPHLVVRRYAIENLVEITAAGGVERLKYRADWSDESLRAKGAEWWRGQLEQGRIRRRAAEAAGR